MRLPVTTHDLDSPESTAKLVNCYVENLPPDARAPYVIRKCPGLKHHNDPTQGVDWVGPSRLLIRHPAGGELFLFQSEGGYYRETRFNQDVRTGAGTSTISDGEYWDAAKDASSFLFTVDKQAYRRTWNGGTSYSLTQITDTDFTARGAEEVEFLDNYFLFREPASARFFGSDVGAPTAYTSTSFATAEAAGDKLVGMKATRANLLLFGEETIEIWDAVGGSGFPFRRIINGAIAKGCANGRTVAEIDDQVLWVANDKTVRLLVGMEPVKISNFAIDRYLERSVRLSSGRAWTYNFAGHNYYVLKFSDRCFVYDLTVGSWHERKTQGIETWAYGPTEQAFGRTWFARDLNPEIYDGFRVTPLAWMSEDSHFELEITNQTHINNGVASDIPMTAEWTYQPVWGSGQRVFHDRLEIVVETGVGNSDSTDPVISLELSDDGGRTWHEMPNRAMGSQGERFQRVVWHNLGSSYQRVYRASCSDPVPLRVMDTQLYAKGGRA